MKGIVEGKIIHRLHGRVDAFELGQGWNERIGQPEFRYYSNTPIFFLSDLALVKIVDDKRSQMPSEAVQESNIFKNGSYIQGVAEISHTRIINLI